MSGNSRPLACVASVFVWFGSKERPRSGINLVLFPKMERQPFSRGLWLKLLVLCTNKRVEILPFEGNEIINLQNRLYFPPFFRRAKPGGKRKASARGATDTCEGKMLPPWVSRVYSAPQLLRAGLRSSVKREKISPVLQTTYNSQMWPLETISLDRVSLMRRAKTPTLRFGTLDASLQVGQWLIVPDSYTCIAIHTGLRQFLKFLRSLLKFLLNTCSWKWRLFNF